MDSDDRGVEGSWGYCLADCPLSDVTQSWDYTHEVVHDGKGCEVFCEQRG